MKEGIQKHLERSAREIEEIRRQFSNHPTRYAPLLVAALGDFAILRFENGESGRAERLFREAFVLLEESEEQVGGPMALLLHLRCAEFHTANRQPEKTADVCKSALELASRRDLYYLLETGRIHELLGAALADLGDLGMACFHSKSALVIMERDLGAEHPDVIALYQRFGLLHLLQKEFYQAELSFVRVLKQWRRIHGVGSDHPDILSAHGHIGYLYQAMGEEAAATEHLERAQMRLEDLPSNVVPISSQRIGRRVA